MNIRKIPKWQILDKLQNHPRLQWWEMTEYLELIPDIALEWYDTEIKRLSNQTGEYDIASSLRRLSSFRDKRNKLAERLKRWREYGVDFIFKPSEVLHLYVDTLSPDSSRYGSYVLDLDKNEYQFDEIRFDEMEILLNKDGQRTFILRKVIDYSDFMQYLVSVTWEGQDPCDSKQKIPVIPVQS